MKLPSPQRLLLRQERRARAVRPRAHGPYPIISTKAPMRVLSCSTSP